MSSSTDGSTERGYVVRPGVQHPENHPAYAELYDKPKDPPIEEDAARRLELDDTDQPVSWDPDAWPRVWAAEWLRSPVAFRELMRHHPTDDAGKCACGQRYDSYARHELEELAKAVEE
jgi:hypothetical protein